MKIVVILSAVRGAAASGHAEKCLAGVFHRRNYFMVKQMRLTGQSC